MRASYDPSLFIDSSKTIFIFRWLDDLFIVAKTKDTDKVIIISGILKAVQGRDLGEATWLLGMDVVRNCEKGTIHLAQCRMIINMLERVNYKDKTGKATPTGANVSIGPDPYERDREKLRAKLATESESTKCEDVQVDALADKAEPLSSEDQTRYMQTVDLPVLYNPLLQ